MVIQRSWKILSDAGSTSASSTEANRSPTGLHSSSDDSNCSNQTTHSMVTSIASPIANKSIETGTSASLNLSTTTITTNEPAVMIQQKFLTTPQMAESMLQRLRQRLNGTMVAGNGESAMRSLELLRISVQQAFDAEINEIVKRFMENYFKPAFCNIKENLGQNAVNDEMLQKMSCALLENAKAQYNTLRQRTYQPAATAPPPLPLSLPPPPPQPQQLVAAQQISMDEQTLRLAVKRPAATKSVMELSNKIYVAATGVTPLQTDTNQQTTATATTQIKPQIINTTILQQKPTQQANNSNSNNSNGITPGSSTPMRRQIFWNTAHISTNTKFVLDVQANLAFGFGTDGKERLASKHPELIRYLPDAEDRDWLSAQNIIPSQNRNSRFLFLIYDEVCRLQQTHELYRNKPNIDLTLMSTFTVPEFMIQKMKLFFVDLNIKSRGLITNSFSIGNNLQSNSHLRNALLQGVQASNGLPTNVGNQNDLTTNGAGNFMLDSGATATVNAALQSSGNNNVNNVLPLKSKTMASTLSSSHATLTALLNNSIGSTSTNPVLDKTNNAKMRN